MTIVEQQHREQQSRPSDQRAGAAQRDLAREHGNHIANIADIAEEQLDETERELAARTQYEDGLQVLSFLVGADWSERVLEIDRVLHDEHGTFSPGKAVEFIELLLAGQSSMQARQAMLARQPRRADRARATRSAVAAARRVSANLHHMAEAPRVQPALPPAGSVPPPSNGVELPRRTPGVAGPRREPIAPALPPLYPPAPPETPAESTGHLLQRVREGGHTVTPEQEAAARKDHQFPTVSPAAIPSARLGDTITMRTDEVLASLAADDASAPADGDIQAPPPFLGASIAGPGAGSSASRDDGDDV